MCGEQQRSPLRMLTPLGVTPATRVTCYCAYYDMIIDPGNGGRQSRRVALGNLRRVRQFMDQAARVTMVNEQYWIELETAQMVAVLMSTGHLQPGWKKRIIERGVETNAFSMSMFARSMRWVKSGELRWSQSRTACRQSDP